eukprot:TRINITY_DN13673_c0_g1_i1.p1 TRINITY_DN13673_c0_g1~~TRINITY_DN13673_c0_g1_i1.p1  ORF type:complete len:733 (+),score=208.04 TRINITY_DN13673_c0_g1_i1:42-2201(+)
MAPKKFKHRWSLQTPSLSPPAQPPAPQPLDGQKKRESKQKEASQKDARRVSPPRDAWSHGRGSEDKQRQLDSPQSEVQGRPSLQGSEDDPFVVVPVDLDKDGADKPTHLTVDAAAQQKRPSITEQDEQPWYLRQYDAYRTSWRLRFVFVVVGSVLLVIDPFTDYYAVAKYYSDGHTQYAATSMIACLLFPWLSFLLHVRQRRKAGLPVNVWMKVKLFILPLYEIYAGWKAVDFMWTMRHDARIMRAQSEGRPSVADQVLVEVEAMAGQEALFETLPQLIIQLSAYFDVYSGDNSGATTVLLISVIIGVLTVIKNVVVWWRLSRTSGIAKLAASPVTPDEFVLMVERLENSDNHEINMADRPALCAVMLSYWGQEPDFFARKRVVDLCNCGLVDRDLPVLLRALRSQTCRIDTLGLGRNHFTSEGAVALEDALLRKGGWTSDAAARAEAWEWTLHPSVRRIVTTTRKKRTASQILMEPEAASTPRGSHSLSSVAVPPPFTSLGLRDADEVSRRTAIELWHDQASASHDREHALRLLSKLTPHCATCGSLSKQCFKHSGAASIRLNLWANKTRVDFSHCSLTDKEVEVLWAGMARPCSLMESIRLNGNDLGDRSASRLAAVIKSDSSPDLTEIYLQDNGVGDEGAKDLAQALQVRWRRQYGPPAEPGHDVGNKGVFCFKLSLSNQRRKAQNEPLTSQGAALIQQAARGYPVQIYCHGCMDV